MATKEAGRYAETVEAWSEAVEQEREARVPMEALSKAYQYVAGRQARLGIEDREVSGAYNVVLTDLWRLMNADGGIRDQHTAAVEWLAERTAEMEAMAKGGGE